MAETIVLSDEEEEHVQFSTPLPSKKPRIEPHTNHTVLVIDDDPTPQKSFPSVVPETPLTVLGGSEAAFVKCIRRGAVGVGARASSPVQKFSGISKFICLESDNESEGHEEILEEKETMGSAFGVNQDSEWRSGFIGSTGLLRDDNLKSMQEGQSVLASTSEYGISQVHDYSDKENMCMEHTSNDVNQKTTKIDAEKNEHEKFYEETSKAEVTQLRENQVLEKGLSSLICLESDRESESDSAWENWEGNHAGDPNFDAPQDSEWRSKFDASAVLLGDANLTYMPGGSHSHQISSSEDDIHQVDRFPTKNNISIEQTSTVPKQIGTQVNAGKKHRVDGATRRKKISEEDRAKLLEEKKQKKEQEKLQKAALKAEAAELRKQQKERKKWESGKLALKSIVALIDSKVLELQSVGGPLLSRFAEKGITYRISSNPIKRSIVWTMNVPDHISQISSNGIEIPYVLLIYEAEEICNLIANGTFLDHVSGIQSRYPSQTICYLTNRLMAYINKREKEQYKNPTNSNRWKSPPVEELMAKLTTHFIRVHSRHCLDEAELAEHVVGLTSSLASCQFRKKLTRLSVNANGGVVPKDCVDKKIINKSPWLKALVAIPKVQPRFAMAIGKRYPTMKSLLRVYMDPTKSVHEKEFLLKDLVTEGVVGGDRRLGEVCSKRVYRILMAQCATLNSDDVEDGADYFRHQQSVVTPSCGS